MLIKKFLWFESLFSFWLSMCSGVFADTAGQPLLCRKYFSIH